MPHEVIMPALGMAQDTGVIVAWHKSPGDAVKTGDVLFEVETDKATMEVEAQADGFVTEIRHHAGDDVPVGEVIALIDDSTEAVHTDETPVAVAAAPAAPAADLPAGNGVLMPALGMAQDTGLIVAWHKAPGDAVAAGDVLFEVETDKSTVEVEAGFDGFVAALLAEAGEEAPVGEIIAVISAEKPANTVQISRAGAAVPAPVTDSTSAPLIKPAPEKGPPKPPRPVKKPAPVSADGRILASPKARRLALEQGLDLDRLVKAGHPQPYHAADIELLKALPKQAPISRQSASRRLVADVPADSFVAFAAWAADTVGLADASALLAGLAAASLGQDSATIAVESFGQERHYTVPAGPLSEIAAADPESPPDLILRDLRMSRITSVKLGPEEVPVLSLTPSGKGLSITLECASHSLGATAALDLLSNFSGRMEQPLRHLL